VNVFNDHPVFSPVTTFDRVKYHLSQTCIAVDWAEIVVLQSIVIPIPRYSGLIVTLALKVYGEILTFIGSECGD